MPVLCRPLAPSAAWTFAGLALGPALDHQEKTEGYIGLPDVDCAELVEAVDVS